MLALAQAVLAGHEAQGRGRVVGARETRDIIERGDERRRGDGPDRRRRGEQTHGRIGRIGRDEGGDARVGGRELAIERLEEREQRRELGAPRIGELGQRSELACGVLGIALRQAEPFAPHARRDQRDVACARPHQRIAHRELAPHVTLRLRPAVHRTIGAEPARRSQRACIALVRLHPPRAGGIHRRVARLGDDHLVAQSPEMPRDPLALGRRLDPNARRRPAAEHRGEALSRGRDPALDQRAVGGQNADLGLTLVKIESYRIDGHGVAGLPVCGSRPREYPVHTN